MKSRSSIVQRHWGALMFVVLWIHAILLLLRCKGLVNWRMTLELFLSLLFSSTIFSKTLKKIYHCIHDEKIVNQPWFFRYDLKTESHSHSEAFPSLIQTFSVTYTFIHIILENWYLSSKVWIWFYTMTDLFVFLFRTADYDYRFQTYISKWHRYCSPHQQLPYPKGCQTSKVGP